MDPSVIAAISGFLGVVVGALATAASTLFFTYRKENREKLVAARLVREDIILVGSTLEKVLEHGWLPGLTLSVVGWHEHRTVLAGHLTDGDWNKIAEAMVDLDRVELILVSLSSGGPVEPSAIPGDGREVIESTVGRLRTANEILRRES